MEVVSPPTAKAPTTAAPIPAIVVRGVRRRYGSFEALAGVDITVPKGALCGLIGPNGAGKTTLLSILATLDEDFDGNVVIDGVDLQKDPALARRRIGFVPDHTAIYDALTVVEYLEFFAAAAGLDKNRRAPAVSQALAICGLEDLAERPAGGLSKGLTQRLCVARALLHGPRVLLLDEPASGLDPRARIELKELLKRLAKDGVTVLISSHILTELGDFCDHVIVLENGRVKAADRVEKLFAAAQSSLSGAVSKRVVVEIVGDADKARGLVETLPSVVDVHHDGQILSITMAAGPDSLAKMTRTLIEGGVDVASVVPERQNLEALFLTLTKEGVA